MVLTVLMAMGHEMVVVSYHTVLSVKLHWYDVCALVGDFGHKCRQY